MRRGTFAVDEAERDASLAWLDAAILGSDGSLWGIDAPFSLPVELAGKGGTLSAQLRRVCAWNGDAAWFGRALAERSLQEHGLLHIRRRTDRYQRTPFDCYHYRIIYQTFHAMRDVLSPLARPRATAILPFTYDRLPMAKRVVVEACPSSTLLRLGPPRRGYKQTSSTLGRDRIAVREVILKWLRPHVRISKTDVASMMTNPGGDALDAVLAGVGVFEAMALADHRALAADDRIPREGWVFA